MKQGDLVLIKNVIFLPGESEYGIFWEDNVDFSTNGYVPDVNCTILWMGSFIPFCKEENVELLQELT